MELTCSLTSIRDDLKGRWGISDQQSGVEEQDKDSCILSVGKQAYSSFLHDKIFILHFPVGGVSHHSVLHFLSPMHSQVCEAQASKTQWPWNVQRLSVSSKNVLMILDR